jgi:DNA sulfur modification protein DndD
MIFNRLELVNFRQFYGHQEVEFSTGDRNVTVFHGANGSGKTTLLNAFTWLFYEKVSFNQDDKLASERALAEAEPKDIIEVRVTLDFEDDDIRYQASRSYDVMKHHDSDLTGFVKGRNLVVWYTDETGNRKKKANPRETLANIIPERLQDVFFFDGETIDQLTQINNEEQVQEAIESVMGITELERAIRHLESAAKRFRKEAADKGSSELQELTLELQGLEDKVAEDSEKLAVVTESLDDIDQELTDIDDELRVLGAATELQERRDRITRELKETKDKQTQNLEDISKQISEYGHIPFAMDAIADLGEFLDDKHAAGELESAVDSTVIESLLKDGRCICDRPVEADSPAADQLQQLLDRNEATVVGTKGRILGTYLGDISENEQAFYNDLTELIGTRKALRDDIQRYQGELSDIEFSLKKIDDDHIVDLEERRESLTKERNTKLTRKGQYQESISTTQPKIDRLNTTIKNEQRKSTRADLAAKRQETCEYLQAAFEKSYDIQKDQVREEINEWVNDTFQSIIAKEFYAEVDETFRLHILKDVGDISAEEVDKSTGERQVASLAFIASLVQLAYERFSEDDPASTYQGGIYPIVMDSPFGSLDPEYQQKVSAILPNMSEQILVMVTDSQWSDAVQGELGEHAGHQYNLDVTNASDSASGYESTAIVPEEMEVVA